MNNYIKKIVKKFNKNYPPDKAFETEHFLYWIRERYTGVAYKEVSEEKFKELRDYVSKNSKLPGTDAIHNTGVESYQKILRYSKKYDQLEYYNTTSELRANNYQSNGKVVIMDRKYVVFKVNSNGFVSLGRKCWLSLKNWNHLTVSLKHDVVRLLMNTMLRSNIASEIEIKPYDISNSVSRYVETPEDLVKKVSGSKPPKIFNKVFDCFYELAKFNKIIEPNQIHMMTNFFRKNKYDLKNLIDASIFGLSNPYDLFYYYFVCKDNRCDITVVRDYCEMLESQDMKINLNIRSFQSIKNKHDELSRYILANSSGGSKLKVSRKFKELKSTDDIEVVMIKTSNRLDDESLALRHCVHSYKTNVNKGDCAIYSLKYDDESFTLELRLYKDDSTGKISHRINQLRGLRNCNPPKSMINPLKEFIRINGLFPLEKSSISFGDISRRDTPYLREFEQVGEKVLRKISENKHPTKTLGNNMALYANDNVELPF